MSVRKTGWKWAAGMMAAGVAATLLGCATSGGDPRPFTASASTDGAVVGMHRLTESQYRNAVADIFGADIKIGGRFDPILRPNQGLIAVGAAQAAISPAGFEQFDVMARTIADQVLDPAHRASFLPCKPSDPKTADPACARRFFATLGTYVYRRPLTPAEIDSYVDLAARGAAPTHDFYAGLKLALASMLVSPDFLYCVETAAPDGRQLDSYSKASRLSFLIWNTTPDAPLLLAASRGELETPQGLRAQVDRMLASPKAEQGARAFFTDFLQLDRVADMSKDTVVYDRFTADVAKDMGEQTLRTALDLLIVRDRPYPELFTTRTTFLNRRLGLLYHAPAAAEGWTAYTFPQDDDRAGILGQGSFLALFSHEGRSSPTVRGRAIREMLLCEPVPNPPANVDFTGFNDTHNAVLKTARQRLAHHATDPVCASCHKITDPLGLPLEGFDGVGAARATENGAPIDTSGSFEGKRFDGAAAMGLVLSQSEAPTECVAKRVAEYATGRDEDHLPDGWLDALDKAFKADGYRFKPLLRDVALSPQLFAVPKPETPAAQVAQAAAQTSKETP